MKRRKLKITTYYLRFKSSDDKDIELQRAPGEEVDETLGRYIRLRLASIKHHQVVANDLEEMLQERLRQ